MYSGTTAWQACGRGGYERWPERLGEEKAGCNQPSCIHIPSLLLPGSVTWGQLLN